MLICTASLVAFYPPPWYTVITGVAAPSTEERRIIVLNLNPDCIRDILLAVEATSTASKAWVYDSASPPNGLSNYSKDETLRRSGWLFLRRPRPLFPSVH